MIVTTLQIVLTMFDQEKTVAIVSLVLLPVRTLPQQNWHWYRIMAVRDPSAFRMVAVLPDHVP